MDPELLKLFQEHAGEGIPDMEPRGNASVLLRDLDYDAQLNAIRALLQRNAEADRALTAEIREVERVAEHGGLQSWRAVDEHVDRLHSSVFQDAAHSMAAVGMLAPFVESVFHQALLQTGEIWTRESIPVPAHPRFSQKANERWDCHFFWNGKRFQKDLVQGIEELSNVTGLKPYLPQGFNVRLAALVAYRNKMFHNGFEWLPAERKAFVDRAKTNWPPTWFNYSKTDGDPWVVYMTDVLISEVLSDAEGGISGIGAFAHDLLRRT